MLVTLEMAQNAVRKHAEQNPDRIAGRTYLDLEGNLVCLVAYALVELGMPITVDDAEPDSEPDSIAPLEYLEDSIGDVVKRGIWGMEIMPDARDFLDNVQAWQDDRGDHYGRQLTWREAYEKAMNNEPHPSYTYKSGWAGSGNGWVSQFTEPPF